MRADAFSLDIKLGIRALLKYWGLTLVGGAAMAAAITLGAALFELLYVVSGSTVPLDEGDRLVVIQPFDLESGQAQRSPIEDYERWRAELRSVDDIGAFRTIERDLVTSNGAAPPVSVAEMSASGFEAARVAPLLGRFLLPEDEAPGAAPVLVIGYDAWQSTFGGDPSIVGQVVQLDDVFHTVVGVMPEDFAFPVNHRYWTSLRTDVLGPVAVFARLAPGATLESAEAEVEAVGLLEPSPLAGDGTPPRPRVVPYVTGMWSGPIPAIVALLSLFLPLLLIPPCANIAILIYARTVARQGELAARTALGATRARLVGQIFIEVLVLAAAATGLALYMAPELAEFLQRNGMPGVTLPFWMDLGLSFATIGYAAGLAVVAALIAGAIPALRATGRLNLACLHALSARSAPKLGKVWMSLVLLQAALSVAVVPMGAEIAWAMSGVMPNGLRFAPDEYLTASLRMDPRATVEPLRFANVRDELVRRLEAEPGVAGVTVAEALPSQETQVRVEVEAPRSTLTAAFNRVDLEFFETFNTRLLIGRGFEAGDREPGRNAVVVNRSFAQSVLGDANPVGRRIRIAAAGGVGTTDGAAAPAGDGQPWLEVVGVVENFSAEEGRRAFYRPLPRIPEVVPAADDQADLEAPRLSIAINANPTLAQELPTRLREIAASLDPDLRVDPVGTMRYESFWLQDWRLASGLAGVMLGVVLFSAAGIYTLLTFTVVQRRREIAVCSALGAPPWRLIAGVFRRALVPVSVGVALGAVAALLMEYHWSPVLYELREGGRPLPWVLPAAEALLIAVGLLAALGPARNALRIDPMRDLREG